MATVYCCGSNQPAKEYLNVKTGETILVLEECNNIKCRRKIIVDNIGRTSGRMAEKLFRKIKHQLKEIKYRIPTSITSASFIYGHGNADGITCTPRYFQKDIKAAPRKEFPVFCRLDLQIA